MDPIKNPFAPGAGSQPPELTGRDQILEDARIAFARIKLGKPERGILLTGLRGVGKTVLLERMRQIANDNSYIVDLMEAPETGRLADLIVPSLRSALVRISRKAKAADVADRAMRVLRSFSLSAEIEGIKWGVKLEPEAGQADSGSLERDLPDLFTAVGEAAKANGTAVALLIDEIQYLSKDDLSALIVSVHRVSQRNLPVLVMGAGLPLLPGLSGEAKSYAERLFRYPKIGALSAADARRALEEPARDVGVRFEPEALDEIVRITAGYPYFIQEWGAVVWNRAAKSPISASDVAAAEAEATRRLDESFFRVRLDRLTGKEQRYLRGMAELGPGMHKTSAIAKLFGKSSSNFGPTRDALIRKGMIYSPKYGSLDFTVPLFDQFMRRAFPTFRKA